MTEEGPMGGRTDAKPTEILYPEIQVALGDLSGPDGNAMMIIGKVSHALRAAQVPNAKIEEYANAAMMGTYAELLATTGRWVTVL